MESEKNRGNIGIGKGWPYMKKNLGIVGIVPIPFIYK
jgi:hypothetical protein